MSPKRVIYSMLQKNNQNIKELKKQKMKVDSTRYSDEDNALEFSFVIFDMLSIR